MTPCYSIRDLIDHPLADVEFLGEILSPCALGQSVPNLPDHFLCEFRGIDGFAARMTLRIEAEGMIVTPPPSLEGDRIAARLSPFGNLVCDVVQVCAEEEVIRADAWRVITMMEYPEAGGDRSVCKFPSKAMSGPLLTAITDSSVPIGLTASPKPAPLRLIDARPESLNHWCGGVNPPMRILLEAGLRTVLLTAALPRLTADDAGSDRGCDTLRVHRKFTPSDVTPSTCSRRCEGKAISPFSIPEMEA